MRFFKWLGPTYLIPWISKTEEALDANGDISSLSGLPPYKYKTYYYGFYWFGQVAGFHRAVIELSDNDLMGRLMSEPCPKCGGELYGNLLGDRWCGELYSEDCDEACGYDINLYKEKEYE